MLISISTLIDQ